MPKDRIEKWWQMLNLVVLVNGTNIVEYGVFQISDSVTDK